MKGIYCLIINVKKDSCIRIGALGQIKFKKGKYVYIGSAQNGIEKRVARHLSQNKKVKWHIDCLLLNSNVKIEKVFYKLAAKKEECKTAGFLDKSEVSIKGFGCSDCKCNAHLFKIKSLKIIKKNKWKILN